MEHVTLERLIETASEQAHSYLIGDDTDRQIPPTFTLASKLGLELIVAPWRDSREKQITFEIIRKTIKEHDCYAYGYLLEAWTSKASKEDVAQGRPKVMPSEDPNRIEIVLAFATDGTRSIMKSWAIKRNDKGACIGLADAEALHDTWGQLNELMGKPTTKH